jgi:(2Fe-2S) ferredoxin
MSKKKPKEDRGTTTTLADAKPSIKVRDYGSHVFLCTGGSCKKRGAKDTRKALKDELRETGTLGDTRVDGVDCLGLCKHGPNAVVYDGTDPKGTWYTGLTDADVPEVVERHLVGGEVVERLAAQKRRKARQKK